jgi:hypothetical protein
MREMTWRATCGAGAPGTGVIENNVSTARSAFARMWVNAHTDATDSMRDRRPTADYRMGIHPELVKSIWRFMAIWPSVECLFSRTPLPGGTCRRA